MKESDKNVVCLGVQDSYSLVVNYECTAHPAVSPYPKKDMDYLIPVMEKGRVEYIYRIETTVDVEPSRIEDAKPYLTDAQYKKLIEYHTKRKALYVYGKKNTPYRFYILGNRQTVDSNKLCVPNLQIAKYLSYSDVPVIK